MSGRTVPQRTAPGVEYSLSAIAVALRPPPIVPPSWVGTTVALLRQARALGVTTFDVPVSSDVTASEEALLSAFPSPDPDLTVILTPPTNRPARPRGVSAAPAAPVPVGTGPAWDASLARLGRRYRVIVDRLHPVDDRFSREVSDLLERRRQGEILDVAVGLGESPAESAGGGPPLRSGALSLLNLALVARVRRAGVPTPFAVIARDPFAGGALDGTLLAGGVGGTGPGGPPPNLAELHDRLDPVLGLGFLTQGRSRTLAQAALEFVLHWPWVLTTIVPLPTPERLGAVLGALSRTGFTDADLARLGLDPTPPGGGPSGRPP